ncbi:hypothetical protein [Sansalvadorimonas verongulae]|uniref:hypothetical protein n=1 Tax=Sansalvadorimonas verongulae TaxID=2172824 RepID=UPI0012BB8ED5|nr:hypothetical protein [Sansalvadorimonas verongulae]MTI13964.1 hypothetical protein [Sansalvadorimonas verongulae]
MKLKSSLLAPGLVMLFTLLANLPAEDTSIQKIQHFISEIYGTALDITDEQISQLSWVLDNPAQTQEMNVTYRTNGKTITIHREVPRALARLYNLQLLRSGKEKDYRTFVQPQLSEEPLFLSYSSFQKLSRLIQEMDEESYEILKTSAIITAVALSPKAIERADVLLDDLPEDSNQFLSQTAPHAGAIYPLVRSVITRFPDAAEKFKVTFLPNANLRHMLYAEGSQRMFESFRQLDCTEDCQGSRHLWIAHWVVNLSGFQGHMAPKGSVYLNQNIFDALNDIYHATKEHSNTPDSPLELSTYITARAQKLNFPQDDRGLAIALLAAQTRIYTPEHGEKLVKAFDQLSQEDQDRWIHHATQQFTVKPEATPMYLPALLASGIEGGGLDRTVAKMLPLILDVLQSAQELREQETMTSESPLSFRELVREENVKRILFGEEELKAVIAPHSGLVTLSQ